MKVEKQSVQGVCLMLLPRVVEGRAGSGFPMQEHLCFSVTACACLPSVPGNAQLQQVPLTGGT